MFFEVFSLIRFSIFLKNFKKVVDRLKRKCLLWTLSSKQGALWNLLCAIDWDPQSNILFQIRIRPYGLYPSSSESLGFELSFRRVWSWLRMNAGGVVKTCKSNGFSSVAIHLKSSGERVRNTWTIYLLVWNSLPKGKLIPHVVAALMSDILKSGTARPDARRGVRGLSASWRGNGSPRLRRVAGLRGWPVTLELRHGPDTYGWQQFRIIHNGRKPDGATPREGRRPSGRKPLSPGKKHCILIVCSLT